MNYDSTLILSLISRIHSQSQDFLFKKLSENGMGSMATSHANILFCLSREKSLTAGELAAKINRDKSTTTILVRKLEKTGYVEVRKDTDDSRRKIISLTREGEKFNQITRELSDDLLKKTWDGFNETEKNSLVSLLNRLSDNLCSR